MIKSKVGTIVWLCGLTILTATTILTAWYTTPTPASVEVVETRYTMPEKIRTAPLNINTANIEELATLPGIGQTLSSRIVAYRDANGPFNRLEDLLLVKGIGKTKLEELLPYIVLEQTDY